jgi:hypothetical protein
MIEGQRIGSASQNILSSLNYTLTPGWRFTSAGASTPGGGNGGGQTGSRIRLVPEAETFISGMTEMFLPSVPKAVPLIGSEAKPGVISEERSERVGETEMLTSDADEGTISKTDTRMRASAIESDAGEFLDERAVRLAIFLLVLSLLAYVRSRTAWGRKHRPF